MIVCMEKTADLLIAKDPEKALELLKDAEVRETQYGDRYLILKENEELLISE